MWHVRQLKPVGENVDGSHPAAAAASGGINVISVIHVCADVCVCVYTK